MVDILALALSHGLLLLAAWRLLWRPELDEEAQARAPSPPPRGARPAMRVRRAAEDDSHGGDSGAEGAPDA